MRFLALSLLALASCNSTSIILKPPLMAGCHEAHIPPASCPDLADGVIAYVDGDKEKAEAKIRDAVRDAAPGSVKTFLKVLKDLDRLPGSDSFMGPVHEIVAMLEGKAETETLKTSAPGASAVSSASGGARAATAAPAVAAIAEVDDMTRLRTSTVIVASNPKSAECTPFAYPGVSPVRSICVHAAIGPILITDLEWSAGCPAETFVLVGDTARPTWFLRAEESRGFSMHGAALVVPEGETLFVGHRLTSKTPLRSLGCAVTWAGKRGALSLPLPVTSTQAHDSTAATPPLRPEKPSPTEVTSALVRVLGQARLCLTDAAAECRANVTFSSAGTVSAVSVTGGETCEAATDCIGKALTKATTPPFSVPSYGAIVTVRPVRDQAAPEDIQQYEPRSH